METTQVSTSVFLRTNDNTKRNGNIRRFWRGEEEEERERQGNEVGGVAGGALYYAKHVFTRWIYGRPLRLPRLFPFLSLAESLFGFLLLVSRPRKTKIIPSCGNGKINRNANSSDAYGCVGEDYPRGGWGQVSRVRNRPWEWISMKPPFLRPLLVRTTILKVGTVSTPETGSKRGCAWASACSCNLCNMTVDTVRYCFWGTTPPRRDYKVRIGNSEPRFEEYEHAFSATWTLSIEILISR